MTTVSPVSPALSQSSTGSKTKKRKQRKVYGAYVDIDNVDQKPGDSFSNWIGLTKEKLRERESALMKIRMGCIKDAIFNAIILFNNNPGNTKHGIKINEQCCKEIEPMINNKDIINSCMNALNGILNQWNGIDLTRSNKEFDTYRQYFVVSKNWFDQRKKDILSKFLWAKILYLIREFSDKAANQFFNTLNNPQLNMMENQSNYRRSLVLSILIKLFESKTQFTATKPQPLIPGGTIKDTKSIKEFFTNFVDPSLTIQQLIKNNTLLLTANKGKDLTAKQTLQLTLDRLRVLSMESQLRLSNNYLSMNKIEIMKTGTPSLTTTTTTTTITSSDDQMSSLSSSRPLSRQPNINQNVNDNNDDSNHSNGYIQNFNNKNNENNIKLYTTTYSQQQPILANLSSITSISSNATSTSTSTPTTVNSNNSGTMDLCDMIKPSLITCSDYNYSNNNNNNYVKSDINNDNNQNNFNFVPSNMSNLVCDTNNIGMESTKIDNNFSVNNNYSVNNNNNYNNYNNNTNGNTNYSINNIHINNININNNNGYCCNNKQSMNNMNNMNAFNDTNNTINNINNNIVNNTYNNNNNNNEYSEYNKYYPNVCVPTNNNNDNNTWNTTNSNINNVSVSNVNINNMNALSELFNQQGILNGYGYGPVHSSSNSTAQNRYNPLSNTSTNINNINNDNINYAVGNNYNNNNNNNHNCDTNTNGCNCNFHHHDHQYRQDYNNKYVQQQSYSHLQHSQHQSCSSYNNNNANNHNNCNCNGCTYNNTYNNY